MRRQPPEFQGNVTEWARKLVSYLEEDDNLQQEEVVATIVSLVHKIAGTEKALIDGLIMFDPAIGDAVVSINGAWHPMGVAAYYAINSYADTVVPATWTALVETDSVTNIVPGVYTLTIDGRATGTNTNAEFAMRIVENGVVLATGDPIIVGNKADMLFSFTLLYTDTAEGDLELQVEGTNTTLSNVTLIASRVGADPALVT